MAQRAKGTFDVDVKPMTASDPELPIGWFALDKRFHGDLEGTSKGVMLGAGAVERGAGGYVALEHVTGTLGGRRGGFVLQHRGSMSPGAMELDIRVVPSTGTGELEGISGRLAIHIVDGAHHYELEYDL